jgi:hypothetical protein
MNAIASITRRSLNQLEDDIISLSSHINATEYELRIKGSDSLNSKEYDLAGNQTASICERSSSLPPRSRRLNWATMRQRRLEH